MFKIVQCRLRDILLQFQGHRFLKTVVFIFLEGCVKLMDGYQSYDETVEYPPMNWFETPAVVQLEAGNEFIKYKNIYIYIYIYMYVYMYTIKIYPPQTINNDWFACLLDPSELKFSKNRKISTHILLEKDNAT